MKHLLLLIYAAPLVIVWLCLRIMGIGSIRFLKIRLRPKAPGVKASAPKPSGRRRARSSSSGGGGGAISGKGVAGLNGLSGSSKQRSAFASTAPAVQDRSADIIRKGLNTQIASERTQAERLRGEQRRLQEENLRTQENTRLQEEARLREELERAQEERRREEERVEEERGRAYS
ncbi:MULTISPECIES: hypothetical protein [Microvirga]|uniref:hypothetical protein n=1 Tax=Microvirga TaxID=186650 RepID=UPI0021C99B98|nr:MULTISPECIES: hypothetical protein [unclassified Microvirga]